MAQIGGSDNFIFPNVFETWKYDSDFFEPYARKHYTLYALNLGVPCTSKKNAFHFYFPLKTHERHLLAKGASRKTNSAFKRVGTNH